MCMYVPTCLCLPGDSRCPRRAGEDIKCPGTGGKDGGDLWVLETLGFLGKAVSGLNC